MAENIEIKIPILKVVANPLIKLVPKPNKMAATNKVVKLPSLIAGQARLNPYSIH